MLETMMTWWKGVLIREDKAKCNCMGRTAGFLNRPHSHSLKRSYTSLNSENWCGVFGPLLSQTFCTYV